MEECVRPAPRRSVEDDDVSVEELERILDESCKPIDQPVATRVAPPVQRMSYLHKVRMEAIQRQKEREIHGNTTQAEEMAPSEQTDQEAYSTRPAMSVNEYSHPLTRHTNVVDNSRHMISVSADNDEMFNSSPSYTLAGWEGAIRNFFGLKVHSEASASKSRRIMRKRVSVDDPNLPENVRTAVRLFMCDTWDSIVSKKVQARDLADGGVTFDELVSEGLGLQDFKNINGTFKDAVRMGFSTKHMVNDPARCGPAVLVKYFDMTFDKLTSQMGLTIDAAVYTCMFNLADLKLLSPSLANLIVHGFRQEHVHTMKVTEKDVEEAFPEFKVHDMQTLFPCTEEEVKAQVTARPVAVRKSTTRASTGTGLLKRS